MVNEVLQWAVLFVVVLLLLGILRQVSLLLPPSVRGQTATGPIPGQRLPRRAVLELEKVRPSSANGHLTHLAFVTEGCLGCQRLLADLERAVADRDGNRRSGSAPVLVAAPGSDEFRNAVEGLGVPVIWDRGELWQDCSITATPVVITVDAEARVIAKEITHRVQLT